MIYDLVVIGAGAGGCFTAIRLAEFSPGARICILEAARKPLSKVEISGGGRCNVTHACFDPEQLIKYYPRGEDVLLEPFNVFQPNNMVNWFRSKGVAIKKEADGRMFPVSNSSATIIDCFMREINRNKIELLNTTRVLKWNFANDIWDITLYDGRVIKSKNLLISSGSDQRIWNALEAMNLKIIPPVPSLFTFNIPDKTLQALMGISKENVDLTIPSIRMKASGPLLITHWGLSGPAILKLSAWGARELYACGYVFELSVNWLSENQSAAFPAFIQSVIKENPKKYIHNFLIKEYPSRLWKYLCIKADIPEFTSGAEFGKKQMKRLMDVLTNDVYRVTGKSTFKEEFVTAGGVDLDEIDFTKFESNKYPGLFLVGEVLNIDAITGGFNFQAAWTGAHIAAKAIAERI